MGCRLELYHAVTVVDLASPANPTKAEGRSLYVRGSPSNTKSGFSS